MCEEFNQQQLLYLSNAISMVRNCTERSIGHLKADVDNNSFLEKSKQAVKRPVSTVQYIPGPQ